MQNASSKNAMDEDEAKNYLQSLLCKNLRVTTTDSRMFWGEFRCTDPESNIVLYHTYEYRHPSPNSIAQAAASTSSQTTTDPTPTNAAVSGTVKLDMTSRYLGLVVVPGRHIVKIEVEGFASQVNKKKNLNPTKNNVDNNVDDTKTNTKSNDVDVDVDINNKTVFTIPEAHEGIA